jgi:hypothetical protein
MTDDEPDDSTLESLESVRADAEDAYLAEVARLEQRVAAVLKAASAAEASAREVVAPPEGPSLDLKVPAASGSVQSPARASQTAWPPRSGGLRGFLNGLAYRLLRDYLAVLDQRHEELTAAAQAVDEQQRAAVASLNADHDQLAACCRRLLATCRELHAAHTAARTEAAERAESLREGLNRIAEALDVVSGVSLKLRTLMNAKDAETVRRVVGGADRKVEVVLDELARRQEALLSELVGRRQELDALIATSSGE